MEYHRHKEKLSEIKTKKEILGIVKNKLRVQSISPNKTRNFVVRMDSIRTRRNSEAFNKISTNTGMSFRNK